MNVLLSLLFKVMLTYGHYLTELLKSTIIFIPKDTTASLSTSDMGSHYLIVLVNYLIMLKFVYVKIRL